MNDIQQSTGLNEAQAVEAAIAASSGTLKSCRASIFKGGFSSSAARNKPLQLHESVAKQTNYSESFDKVMSASQDFSEANNDTKNSELGRIRNCKPQSCSKPCGMRYLLLKTKWTPFPKTSLQAMANPCPSTKISPNPFLSYIAHQPVNSGPNGASGGQIGYEGARRIIENGGSEARAYISASRKKTLNTLFRASTQHKAKADLSSKFESESAKLKANSDVAHHHAQNTENVLTQGKDRSKP